MGIGLCTGRKCSYKSHRTQDIRHFLISSKTNPYSRADYPPASPSATYFKREHLPISLLCSSLIAPGFSNLPHNLTTLSYERLHSSEKRILNIKFEYLQENDKNLMTFFFMMIIFIIMEQEEKEEENQERKRYFNTLLKFQIFYQPITHRNLRSIAFI